MNVPRIIQTAAALALVVLVGWAFTIVGSPAHNRALMEDKAQIDTINCLACRAQDYACDHGGQFPPDAQTLQSAVTSPANRWCNHEGLSCNYQTTIDRPVTTYQYSANGSQSYSLCVDMHFDAAAQSTSQPRNGYGALSFTPDELKHYTSGKQCIAFKPRNCPKKMGRINQ